ncbi:MAG: MtnX-like HAD-IB family phosphatase [Candidatus Melainabacteria bacterium]|nr:MtnX-like HAD-IB family phosphatase [Candidatus Melainabacteria bacterium]MBI3309126.1 MtnX-like HAD-IB family phosphatase [Candidatus Melainabacteria bacterium]
MIQNQKTVIFSDFDGTITKRDVIVMIMEKFAPPPWEIIKDKILYERSITLKEGVEKLFKLIESKKKQEIIEFVKHEVKLREGFKDFLDLCNSKNIDFNVVSGGLDFFVEPVLESFKDKIKIFCNKGNFASEKISIDYKYLPKNCMLCGDCGCCKIEIIENYPKHAYTRILIGDSLTDLAASKVVDLVFARGDLIKYLKEENISYIPYNNFFEVKEQLIHNQLIKN